MAGVIDQDAGMGMERLGPVRQHARTLGGQRIEGAGLGGRRALAGGQAPVEAAEGDADGPGEKVISGQWIVVSGLFAWLRPHPLRPGRLRCPLAPGY